MKSVQSTTTPPSTAELRSAHNAVIDAEIELRRFARNGWTPEGAFARWTRLEQLRHEREQLRRVLARAPLVQESFA